MIVFNPTSSPHTHTIINLHGRGSNASEYSSEFFESESSTRETLQSAFPTFKWVFPTAPQLVSKRFGVQMSQWFDMWSTEDPLDQPNVQDAEEQTLQLRQSIDAIAKIVQDEGRIIGSEKVILGGISQGAATAIITLLEMQEQLCAFVGFSTWLPSQVTERNNLVSMHTPVFLAHCCDDEIIDVKYGQALAARLKVLEPTAFVEFHRYRDGGHWINEPQGIDDVIRFLRRFTGIGDKNGVSKSGI